MFFGLCHTKRQDTGGGGARGGAGGGAGAGAGGGGGAVIQETASILYSIIYSDIYSTTTTTTTTTSKKNYGTMGLRSSWGYITCPSQSILWTTPTSYTTTSGQARSMRNNLRLRKLRKSWLRRTENREQSN